MNLRFPIVLLASLTLLISGCSDCEDCVYDPAPAAPQGVYSITADGAVYLYWNGPYESDINDYIIWRSFDPVDNYVAIDSRPADNNPNLDLIVYEYIDRTPENGVTYYYAVSSVDRAGHESELSAENVFDTPRPEGEVTIYAREVRLDSAGFYLNADARVVSGSSSLADIYIDRPDQAFYINGGHFSQSASENVDIQDMGYTYSFDDIGYAPDDGWSRNGWAEVVLGHTYVIWTGDLHFAKMRCTAIDEVLGTVSFQWAYQTDQGNLELALPVDMERPPHDSEYPKPKTMGLLR